MKHVRDVEQCFDLLKKCQDVFKRLNGDSLVMLKEMERLNIQIENLIGDDNE